MTIRDHHHHSNGYLKQLSFHAKPDTKQKRCQFIRTTSLRFFLLVLTICMSSTVFLRSIPRHPPEIPCITAGKRTISSTTDAAALRSKRKEEVVTMAAVPKEYRENEEEAEFWKQPNGLGYTPCLNFSQAYKRSAESYSSTVHIGSGRDPGRTPHTEATMARRWKRRFLMVVVAGGLNQQRNQIIDAVVIARILDATLVVPILQVNAVWADESEFCDIFDEVSFKEMLKEDVHVVSSLPSRHLRTRPIADSIREFNVDEKWIRTHFQGKIQRNGVLLLRGLDSRLSKDLNPDLQKLRCKVAFYALQFRAAIHEQGEKLAARMAREGPYLALHLRLEKDVWIRTGCLPGLGNEMDRTIDMEREAHPDLLTGRANMPAYERYLAGLCPLTSMDTARLLKALGATSHTRIYLAGGEPFGGAIALEPLHSHFPNIHSKRTLATPGELEEFKGQASVLAALDYIVCLKSQVFMANHGGNMARAMQGHRAFLGHRKYITPNKKGLVDLFVNNQNDTMNEQEMNNAIKMLHAESLGAPLLRTDKEGRDVIAYPVPECMCTSNGAKHERFFHIRWLP